MASFTRFSTLQTLSSTCSTREIQLERCANLLWSISGRMHTCAEALAISNLGKLVPSPQHLPDVHESHRPGPM
ncbi:hypothetical protein BDM02DRAFT_2327505 [Thelephora ganbajun]|uniref:Uncharacterized protein n=1 Tax=Thelephora ganbajun TaxID=370292 RepID=A0ACB6YYG2_THEGA|nr:hypothetical protein BDM02DRAFT_2327505 [Thelephora ganbajun]